MKPEIIAYLLEINQKFYADFSGAFAQTRRRIQPGVRRILNSLPPVGRWLDLGCGSGALAEAIAASGRQGLYCGLDLSAGLLAEAAKVNAACHVNLMPPGRPCEFRGKSGNGLELRFLQADLAADNWAEVLHGQMFEAVFAFAVLHHLPGKVIRRGFLQQVHNLLAPGGVFIHSEWQFQHSPRLMARVQPWETVGLSKSDLEEGDTLLDWRHALPTQTGQTGLRYVHLFNRVELADLASTCGFRILDEFDSDGKEGNLAVYQRLGIDD